MGSDLSGKTVIVTGAGQGIGRAYARHLAALGASVVVAERNVESGKVVVDELAGDAIFIEVDVSDEASCEAMAATALDRFGRIDGLINNAAIFSTLTMRPFWEIPVAEWDAVLAVNLKGVWLATKAIVPAMREQGGSIVNISSGVVWLGRANYAHYVASKAGVIGLTRAMARELGDSGIRVNAITPGPVYTEVPRETVSPEQKQAMLAAQCLKRTATPDDLLGTVVFLLSSDSAFITGQTINVDGGLSHH